MLELLGGEPTGRDVAIDVPEFKVKEPREDDVLPAVKVLIVVEKESVLVRLSLTVGEGPVPNILVFILMEGNTFIPGVEGRLGEEVNTMDADPDVKVEGANMLTE